MVSVQMPAQPFRLKASRNRRPFAVAVGAKAPRNIRTGSLLLGTSVAFSKKTALGFFIRFLCAIRLPLSPWPSDYEERYRRTLPRLEASRTSSQAVLCSNPLTEEVMIDETETDSCSRCSVILAEDNAGDVRLVREALREYGVNCELRVLSDGEEVLNFFDGLDADKDIPCPDLLLLDLSLPKYDGRQILEYLRV